MALVRSAFMYTEDPEVYLEFRINLTDSISQDEAQKLITEAYAHFFQKVSESFE